jgi:hypothetical protein
MITPIGPQDTYIIYKAREQELELKIQRRLAREARGEMEPVKQPWYARAARWLSVRDLLPAFIKQAAVKPAALEEPCPVVPCYR